MSEYLLEIGSGELPYTEVKAIPPALKRLFENFFESDCGVLNKPLIESYSTPRRIFLFIKNLPMKTEDKEIEIIGPPLAISYRDDAPTPALIQFMKKNGIKNAGKIYPVSQKKGVYAACKKKIKGAVLKNLLKEKVPALIKEIPFKKSMFWVDKDVRYPRPVLWITSVFDNKPLPFHFGDIKASDRTYIFASGLSMTAKIDSPDTYFKFLSSNGIILKNDDRRLFVEKQLDNIAKRTGTTVLDYDDDFMDEIVGLNESPYAIACKFDKRFISLPKELLSIVMKKHQRFFPMMDGNVMAPSFIGVADVNRAGLSAEESREIEDNIGRGYSRVLTARLSDADFFFKDDLKNHIRHFIDKTKDIMFYKGLGSYFHKTERIKKIGSFAAKLLNFSEKIKTEFESASEFLKFDLATHMVYEFPEMQGIAGRIYLARSKESESVSNAVEEHYYPMSVSKKRLLPSSDLSALCALSDKLDTVLAFSMLKKMPTGESDPFYLRRSMIGIIEIIIEKKYVIKLKLIFDYYFSDIFTGSLIGKDGDLESYFGHPPKHPSSEVELNEIQSLFVNFAVTRFKNYLLNLGYKPDEIASAVDFDDSLDFYSVYLKTGFISKYKLHEEFFELSQSYKRIKNITINFKDKSDFDIKNFTGKEEIKLAKKLFEIRTDSIDFMGKNEYEKAMHKLYELNEPINSFFDNVLIMDKDEGIKNARLGLLNNILILLTKFCDFSALSY